MKTNLQTVPCVICGQPMLDDANAIADVCPACIEEGERELSQPQAESQAA